MRRSNSCVTAPVPTPTSTIDVARLKSIERSMALARYGELGTTEAVVENDLIDSFRKRPQSKFAFRRGRDLWRLGNWTLSIISKANRCFPAHSALEGYDTAASPVSSSGTSI